jgi:DNA primase
MSIPRIHPDTIEEVKEKSDIIDIISDYIVLRKKGKDYQGLCPFHEEKTPSFTVSPTKQLYYCFGCGAGGNIFKFLMELNKSSFAETVLELAQRYQIPIKTLERQQKQELERQLSLKEQLYEILAVTTNFYQYVLYQDTGSIALEYLKKNRNFSEETIQNFRLGYAPAGWETLYHYLVEVKRYPLELVAQAGLIKPRNNNSGYYDNFRDRLMIPICDLQGRVIAFGGRSLGDEQPKYLNSPETILFEKSKILFCLDKAKNSISKEDKAIVVEGYFDAISLHSVGITNAVASLGTALQKQQITYLSRYTESKQIIFNFDTDKAGIEATKRAINEIENLVYSGQVNLRIIELPEGKDADEYIKTDPDNINNYRNLLENAPLWIDWQISQFLVDQDFKNAIHVKQITQDMLKILGKIEDKNQRTHYLSKCGELLGQGDSKLIGQYTENLMTQLKKPQIAPKKGQNNFTNQITKESNLLKEAEELLLIIYLHCPEYRETIINQLDEKNLDFSYSIHRSLWQLILELELINEEKGENKLLEKIEYNLMENPEKMPEINHFLILNEHNREKTYRAALIIKSALAAMELVICEKYARECLKKWRTTDQFTDTNNWKYYWEEAQKTKVKIKELEKQRTFSNMDIIYNE